MFTGLIEEVGKITKIEKAGEAVELVIECNSILADADIDDSICVNGVCLTVETFTNNSFKATAVEETMRKTNLGDLALGSSVNLERAMSAGDRFGGHYVQGHTDTTTAVHSIVKETKNWLFTFDIPENSAKYLVERGSITINGVSLTIATIQDNKFTVAIIPHTFEYTTFKDFQPGTRVNLEFDIIGKYVENMLKYKD
ncbi:MAG: riboflavin synthase [Ignavibacteriae bacterium HGW-Ignavibacteriae-4]|nr:MAG: riboflavin synthase [Ignavibacteriae bacterium HGW-Ignavibacteriae-4]